MPDKTNKEICFQWCLTTTVMNVKKSSKNIDDTVSRQTILISSNRQFALQFIKIFSKIVYNILTDNKFRVNDFLS